MMVEIGRRRKKRQPFPARRWTKGPTLRPKPDGSRGERSDGRNVARAFLRKRSSIDVQGPNQDLAEVAVSESEDVVTIALFERALAAAHLRGGRTVTQRIR